MHRAARVSLLTTIAIVALIVSCSEPAAPPPEEKLDVSLNLNTPQTSYSFTVGFTGEPELERNVSFWATAYGNTRARLQSGAVRFFYGPDRDKPLDSAWISPVEMRQFWASDTIGAGQSVESQWGWTADLPFEVQIDVHYDVPETGRKDTVSTPRFSCGPQHPGGVVPPPTLDQLTFTGSSDPLEPGDTIIVGYAASSSYGLVTTAIEFSGAFAGKGVFDEKMALSKARTARFEVPSDANANSALRVRVSALDAAGQEVWRESSPLIVVDVTPPRIYAMALTEGRMSGTFAVGEKLPITIAASDNGMVTKMIYTVSGGGAAPFTDSVASTNKYGPQNFSVTLPVRPEWLNSLPAVSMFVRDSVGLVSPTVTVPTDSIRIIPTMSYPARQGTMPSYSYVAYDARREALYLATGSKVDVFALTTMATVATIPLPAGAAGMDLSPSGDSLVVALPRANSIAVIDLLSATPTTNVIRLAVLDAVTWANPDYPGLPRLLSVAANGKVMIYMIGRVSTGESVVEHDLRTGAERLRPEPKSVVFDSNNDQSVGATGDRSILYSFNAGCSQLYVAATDTFSACKTTTYPTGLTGSSADRTGTRFAWGENAYDAQLNKLPGYPGPLSVLAFPPDGQNVYSARGTYDALFWNVAKARTDDRVFVENIPVVNPVSRLYVAPDGKHLVAIQALNKVHYVDLP